MKVTLKELAQKLEARIIGDENKEVVRIANLGTAKADEISFLSDKKMHKYLAGTGAGAVILREEDLPPEQKTSYLVVSDPYVAFALTAQIFDTTPPCAVGIHPSAVIAPSAKLGANVSVGANAVIEEDAEIGEGAQIGAGCFIGKKAKIGRFTKLWSNVSIYHDCVVGDYCLFQAGAVIGSDGFGYANAKGTWIKIPQVGRVVIGNHVEIGANTTVDRGALDDTEIADNVIIDNQVIIAHNDKIGYGSAIAGGAVFAGSVDLGRFCSVGGTSVFNGHLKVCDGVQVLGQVGSDIKESGKYFSYWPVQDARSWLHFLGRVNKIEELTQRLKNVESVLAETNKNKE